MHVGDRTALNARHKRLHPSLAFYKLWAFWSMLLGGIVALLFALGVVGM
jgi:hypothetical protein